VFYYHYRMSFSISASKEAKSFFISWKCNPVVGSSKYKQCFFFCRSFYQKSQFYSLGFTTGNVEEDCPNWTYPNPTSCNGFNFCVILCLLVSFKKSNCIIVMVRISLMFFPAKATSSTSFLNRLPLQVSQGNWTSAKNHFYIDGLLYRFRIDHHLHWRKMFFWRYPLILIISPLHTIL
jgi:hypothetical protein